MHGKGIAHRDLKLENLLIDDKCVLKIIDFGFAAPFEGSDGSGMNKTFVGTWSYLSPEMLEKKAYSGCDADLFALGVLIFIMRSKEKPFKLAQENDLHYYNFCRHRSELFWQ